MRQIQKTWLSVGLLALTISAGPAMAQKKDDKAVPAADPKQLLLNGIVGATNEAMKGAPGTSVYTADPVAKTVVADPSTTVATEVTMASAT